MSQDALFTASSDRIHGWPDATCKCGRIHCGDCGDIYPCRWTGYPQSHVRPAHELPPFMLISGGR